MFKLECSPLGNPLLHVTTFVGLPASAGSDVDNKIIVTAKTATNEAAKIVFVFIVIFISGNHW